MMLNGVEWCVVLDDCGGRLTIMDNCFGVVMVNTSEGGLYPVTMAESSGEESKRKLIVETVTGRFEEHFARLDSSVKVYAMVNVTMHQCLHWYSTICFVVTVQLLKNFSLFQTYSD